MKMVVCVLFVVGMSLPTIISQEAFQIVRLSESHAFEYVQDNKLEKILNSDEIKDRYVAVVSIVGMVQSGKSLMLNLFLNYLRRTYKIWSPFANRTYEHDWMNMNVTNGFNTTQNRNGTTKGIWAWSEIFTHDNITYGTVSGYKIAIIVIDTEGLFHIDTDLRHNTMIFALSTMFSSMQGYNVFKDVKSDTMQFLDIFSTYTVYGSRFMVIESTQPTEAPFQDFYFIVRESNESEKPILDHIFPDNDNNDQNRGMKTRIKSIFKKIRAFQIPYPGVHVGKATFNGSATLINQGYKDKVATVAAHILAPENIVMKEINGERIKAKEFAHFLKSFTNIVGNNITIATTLVEVLANASNWMVYQNCLQYYDDLMRANLIAVGNTSKAYLEQDELQEVHLKNKNTSMWQFKDRIKLGGQTFASIFERMLHDKIDERFIYFQDSNNNMRLEQQEILEPIMWSLLSCVIVFLALLGVVYVCKIITDCRNQQRNGSQIQNTVFGCCNFF